MLDALLALTVLAAAAPKVAYTPDPARATDVGAIELATPRRHACFGVLKASMLLSSRKADRGRFYVLSVTVADSPAPETIEGGSLGGAPLKLGNVRNGDVACSEYQCPTGSIAVFEIAQAQRQALVAAGSLPLQVRTSSGGRCEVNLPVTKTAMDALDAWADGLPAAAGG
jgi:hypothetical protein